MISPLSSLDSSCGVKLASVRMLKVRHTAERCDEDNRTLVGAALAGQTSAAEAAPTGDWLAVGISWDLFLTPTYISGDARRRFVRKSSPVLSLFWNPRPRPWPNTSTP